MQQLKLYQEPYVCLAEHKRTKHKVREKRWSQLHLDLLVQILVSSAVIASTTINILLQQLTDPQDEIPSHLIPRLFHEKNTQSLFLTLKLR